MMLGLSLVVLGRRCDLDHRSRDQQRAVDMGNDCLLGNKNGAVDRDCFLRMK